MFLSKEHFTKFIELEEIGEPGLQYTLIYFALAAKEKFYKNKDLILNNQIEGIKSLTSEEKKLLEIALVLAEKNLNENDIKNLKFLDNENIKILINMLRLKQQIENQKLRSK